MLKKTSSNYSNKERSDKILLEDILESIRMIEEYTKGVTQKDFLSSPMLLDSVIRRLEIIGEAINNISEELKEKYSIIPWREIAGMRNKLIHEYFGVDKKLVWRTIKKDLPDFKKNVAEVLKEYR